MMIEILLCLIAYGIGSLSSAVMVCRWMKLPDPRTSGSKNPGATNVLRLGGKKAAIATLIGDILKGALPVLIAVKLNFSPEFIGAIALAVFMGHLYPLFFGFQGGKGVATAFGALFALNGGMGLVLVVTWILVAVLFGYSSIASLSAALVAPIYTACFLDIRFVVPVLAMSLLVFWRHRNNIKRIWQGKEPKIGKKTS